LNEDFQKLIIGSKKKQNETGAPLLGLAKSIYYSYEAVESGGKNASFGPFNQG